jgi:hypothetical protein
LQYEALDLLSLNNDNTYHSSGGVGYMDQLPAPGFDPERVRDYIQHGLAVTKACVLEMILKDTHTCEGHPERFSQWSRIARQLVEA